MEENNKKFSIKDIKKYQDLENEEKKNLVKSTLLLGTEVLFTISSLLIKDGIIYIQKVQEKGSLNILLSIYILLGLGLSIKELDYINKTLHIKNEYKEKINNIENELNESIKL